MTYKSIKDKLFYIGITLMFLLPAFPSGLKPKIIATAVIFLAINFSKKDFDYKRFLLNSSIYFLIVISILYSENMDYALKKLQTMSSLIVFPFAFAIIPSEKIKLLYKNKNSFLFLYVAVIVAINLFFFAYHFWHYKSSLITHYITVTRIKQGDFNIHPIYLSMHISIALIFSFFLIKRESNKSRLALLFLLDIILIFFLFIQLKKGPILGLGICFSLFVLLQKNKKLWLFYVCLSMITVFTIISVPKLNKKFAELSTIENIESGSLTSTNIRYSIYDYALATIKKSPIIGHGIGDFNDELFIAYKESPLLLKNRFNTHNQYLSITIALGLLGLTLFIIILIHNYVYAIIYNNQELLLILIFYCFVMGSENILEREDGVIFFSLFTSFFGLFLTNEFKNKPVKEEVKK